MVEESNNDTKFPHKLLLTNTQALTLRKFFVNGLSAGVRFSKAHCLRWCSQDNF